MSWCGPFTRSPKARVGVGHMVRAWSRIRRARRRPSPSRSDDAQWIDAMVSRPRSRDTVGAGIAINVAAQSGGVPGVTPQRTLSTREPFWRELPRVLPTRKDAHRAPSSAALTNAPERNDDATGVNLGCEPSATLFAGRGENQFHSPIYKRSTRSYPLSCAVARRSPSSPRWKENP
jgi:hypothetical protein